MTHKTLIRHEGLDTNKTRRTRHEGLSCRVGYTLYIHALDRTRPYALQKLYHAIPNIDSTRSTLLRNILNILNSF